MASYSIAEAETNLSKLLDLMLAGEDVAITRDGKPIERLIPKAPVATPVGKPMDLEWIRGRRIVPASGTDFDSAEMIRQMRDEGY